MECEERPRPRNNQQERARARANREARARVMEPRVFDRASRLRFARDRTAELIAHLGRAPSYPERILISRIIAVEWELRRLDAKLDAGEELSGHALRARLAAENRLRLDLKELGLRPPVPEMTVEQTLAALHGGAAA